MVASLVGSLHGAGYELRGPPPLPAPGSEVVLHGWLEAELDGGALLHTQGRSIRLRRGRIGEDALVERSGAAVVVAGAVDEPWHPRAAPAVVVESLEPWRVGSVEAPGVPPLSRGWMRFRLDARASIRARLAELFPDRVGLAAALILADRSSLPPHVREAFAASGTAHLLAISGFHVGILAGWVILALGLLRAPRDLRPPIASGLVWLYVAVLGFPTSAVRAALLISAVSAGRARGRPVHGLGAWGLALALVTLADPHALHGAGAQLSFSGSLGLILGARPLSRVLGGERPGALARWPVRVRHPVGAAVAVSVAAQTMTLPLVVWHFQRLPLAALPASVLATPLVAVALPGVVLALVVDVVLAPAARVVAVGADTLLGATVGAVELLAGIGGVVWAGPGQLLTILIGVLVGGFLGGRGKGARTIRGRTRGTGLSGPGSRSGGRAADLRRRRLRGATAGAGAAGILAPVLIGIVAGGASTGVEIHLLDVGQGDAIAVRSPRGAWGLVDARPGNSDALLRQLARRGIQRIETLVLTHPDLDHVGGAAEVIRTVRVGRVVGPGLLRGTEALREALGSAERGDVPWAVVRAGERWSVDELEFHVLHAGEPGAPPNDQSVVLHLRFGDFDALLTGDVSSTVEDGLPGLLGPDVKVEVLKVAHHGSRSSTSSAFLDHLDPDAALISVGRRNRFGHPTPDVLRRLLRRAIPIHRTDRSGSLRVRARSDGSFRISSEFGGPIN